MAGNASFRLILYGSLRPFAAKKIAVVTLEPLGKRRKEFVPLQRNEGCAATERAGASESTVTVRLPNISIKNQLSFVIETPAFPFSYAGFVPFRR